jgi:hypothetical protein
MITTNKPSAGRKIKLRKKRTWEASLAHVQGHSKFLTRPPLRYNKLVDMKCTITKD